MPATKARRFFRDWTRKKWSLRGSGSTIYLVTQSIGRCQVSGARKPRYKILAPYMKLTITGTIKRLNIQHRTSNMESLAQRRRLRRVSLHLLYYKRVLDLKIDDI